MAWRNIRLLHGKVENIFWKDERPQYSGECFALDSESRR